ncbi:MULTISPECIES: hypothetical protein [Myroides]|uniref:hypothetical protein n=1 Tax=Myroides TaxID=76831 RepID=UPI0025763B67|nr:MULTISPECIES: hypothetical protein [Myroides]MDM1377657.1 hypothetical protein [Myroides marinus]MDM1385139.1 hypothetical protein [Myroides marinus]MDM1392141.1 hypothetical protein [Myroides marinus]MEC4028572.1 hypothetical protein [Myroides odoratimimus]
MKLEIGESLILSYLKHVKKCVFYQTNWKISSKWETFNDEKVQTIYDKIKSDVMFDVFKKSQLSQLLKQAEIDVIGMDSSNTIYAIDIAFHEAGLNYGSKEETKNRILKKLLRSYLSLLSYFPDKNYELIFASPKVNNATEAIIHSYFFELEKKFSNENVKFKFCSNKVFKDEILIPTIKNTKVDSDTNELFLRATRLLGLFNMYTGPTPKRDILEIEKHDLKHSNNNFRLTDFIIEFIPNDEKLFKQKLIITKKANRTWIYSNGKTINDTWDASKFTNESNLRGNISSNNKVRNRNETGLIKLILEISE